MPSYVRYISSLGVPGWFDADVGALLRLLDARRVWEDGDTPLVWPTWSGASNVFLGYGEQELEVSGDVAWAVGLTGPQTLRIDGDAGMVTLGRGDDVLEAGRVEVVLMGRGDDLVELDGGTSQAWLGRGDDTIIFRDGAEIDAAAGAGTHTVLRGGRGEDRFETDRSLGDFDFHVRANGRVEISDRLSGATTELRSFESFGFANADLTFEELRDLVAGDLPPIFVSDGTQNVSVSTPDPGLSTVWNRAVIESVIHTELPSGPTVASRAYAMVHTAIFDAWAAFAPDALRIAADAGGDNAALRAEIEAAGLVGDLEAQAEAMSYAAYTVLRDLFPGQEELHDSVLVGRYGLDRPGEADGLAFRVGRDAGLDLIAERATDGANQAGLYADTSGYAPVNGGPDDIVDIARWTPENVPIDPEDGTPDQTFLTAHWGGVTGFALEQGGPLLQLEMALADPEIRAKYEGLADLDAAPEPFFTEAFADATLDIAAGTITTGSASGFGPAGTVVPVTKALIGEVVNPAFILQAEIVLAYSASLGDPEGASDHVLAPSGDAGKLSSEFYEDGPGTGFPPGTAMTHAEFVSARDDLSLGEDALLFLAVGNAVFDAGIATWESKVAYDYARPVRVIRELGELGLIGEQGTDWKGDTGFVVEAYIPELATTGMVLATEWTTYQTPGGDPSPPFAEYTSGHSAFSAAGAAVIRAFTGNDDFGGTVFFPAGSTAFEPGMTPVEDFTITWDTWSDAADAAGLSRLYGGIHFPEGDVHSRALGEYVGADVFELAQSYADGSLLA